MPIAVVNHIQAKDIESFRKILENFSNRAGLVDKFPGFIEFKLFASEEELKIMVMTIWESREAFEAWVNSEEFKKGHSRARRTSINAESKGVIYELLTSE